MPITDLYSLSNKGIGKELGTRIKALRLRKNITQQELAATTTLSLNVIKALESGRGKLSTIIAVLRELGALDQLNSFIPEPTISPIQLAKMQGKVRERASGDRLREKSQKEKLKDEPQW